MLKSIVAVCLAAILIAAGSGADSGARRRLGAVHNL